jgi:restriction endonuclease S subunit
MKKIENLKWKEFDIKDIFPNIMRGRRLKTDDHISGQMPYVSSSAMDNGVDNFVSNNQGVRIFNNCITIANSGSVGASFYHPYYFVASDHVTSLANNQFNKYIYLFVATIASRLSEKYSFNREIKDSRLQREKMMLPVNDNDEPDYEFMEEYMRNIEYRLIKRYINNRLNTLEAE